MNKNHTFIIKGFSLLTVLFFSTSSFAQCKFDSPQANDLTTEICQNQTASGNLSDLVENATSDMTYVLLSSTGNVQLASNGSYKASVNPDETSATFTARVYLEPSTICADYDSFPCNKQVRELDILYLGDFAKTIEFVSSKGDFIAKFENVATNQHLVVNTMSIINPSRRNEWRLYVDGVLNTGIHTSCSQEIFGITFGSFYVYAGTDGKGNTQEPSTTSHTDITVTINAKKCMSLASGKVFNDDNNNGTQDKGETGAGDVSVYVFEDSNNNGVLDSDETDVITDASTDENGDYNVSFDADDQGKTCYLFAIEDNTQKSGYAVFNEPVCFKDDSTEIMDIDFPVYNGGSAASAASAFASASASRVENESVFTVYPNPAKTKTEIYSVDQNSEITSLEVTDGFGLNITDQVKMSTTEKGILLKLANLRNGSYILSVYHKGGLERHTLQVSR